jgi:hypothetical protein
LAAVCPSAPCLQARTVHDSRVALPLTRISAQRVDACYELMDAAYCSTVIREEIQAAGRIPLIDHNPRKGVKREFAPHVKLSATKPDQVQSVAMGVSKMSSVPDMCRHGLMPR